MTQFELFFHFLSPSHRPRFNKHVNETEKSFEVNYKYGTKAKSCKSMKYDQFRNVHRIGSPLLESRVVARNFVGFESEPFIVVRRFSPRKRLWRVT